jgi:hypothetical protein
MRGCEEAAVLFLGDINALGSVDRRFEIGLILRKIHSGSPEASGGYIYPDLAPTIEGEKVGRVEQRNEIEDVETQTIALAIL